jgi:hypothetical protein
MTVPEPFPVVPVTQTDTPIACIACDEVMHPDMAATQSAPTPLGIRLTRADTAAYGLCLGCAHRVAYGVWIYRLGTDPVTEQLRAAARLNIAQDGPVDID